MVKKIVVVGLWTKKEYDKLFKEMNNKWEKEARRIRKLWLR